MAREQRLGREIWTRAALDVLGERGVAGLAIEPLARSLGTTKGSFYWHFRNREELIRAALERWENEETDAVIAMLGPLADARSRLRELVTAIFLTHGTVPDRSLGLAADASHPAVAEVLARVTRRRIGYVAEQLVTAGLEEEEAQHRAVLAYTSYLGYSTLMRSTPDVVPRGPQAEAFLDSMMRVLLT
ncbi:TetR/AcrR family transcriptional regulator [Blastococcus haudaquaticus]|uniref:TetR/AcrR family transcriptional regulator n=1 Tax=Blastococcus haudaquaticus TaxID=1938745 RepID=UPI00190E942E|nr:TetR/AcrR family transcriptional regulator [Blastococcus haudaquaticus]